MSTREGKCVRILEKCRAAIGNKDKGGKVVVVDMVVMNKEKDYVATETQLQWDMAMMVQTSGKERAEQDWVKIFNDAGFSGYQITPLLGLRSIIQVFP